MDFYVNKLSQKIELHIFITILYVQEINIIQIFDVAYVVFR